jgi:hypothetical protein
MKNADSLAFIQEFHSAQSRHKRLQFTREHPVFLRSDLMLSSYLRFALFCLFYCGFKENFFRPAYIVLHVSPIQLQSFNNVRWKRRDFKSFILYFYQSSVTILSYIPTFFSVFSSLQLQPFITHPSSSSLNNTLLFETSAYAHDTTSLNILFYIPYGSICILNSIV